MDQTSALQGYGKNTANSAFATSERVIHSTIFYEAAASISTQSFFSKSFTAANQYQNAAFPLDTGAYVISGISIAHNMQVAASDAGVAAETQQYFEEYSFINFDYRRRSDRLSFSLADLVPWTQSVDASQASNISQYGKRQRFFYLKEPLKIGMNQDLRVEFDPAQGLTTGTYAATSTVTLPGSGLTTNSGAGFFIKCSLYVTEYNELA